MKKIGKNCKAAIGLSVVIILFLTGVSYSAWSDTLSIRGMFTTGSFGVEFGDEKDIEVNLIKTDAQNNIECIQKNKEFNAAKNDNDKYIVLSLTELINELKRPGYMLQLKYPIKTSDDSKIKVIKPIKVNFNKPDEIVDAIPSIKVILGDELIIGNEEVNESDYKIRFKVYRQIETEKDNNYAVVFLEADNFNEVSPEVSVEYDDLTSIFPETDISQGNSELSVQLEAEYSIAVPIMAEQFNNGE
jgi:predicted ribosomally synthesized peptide with SipW-like signal peptide